jgi:hypothetical protein
MNEKAIEAARLNTVAEQIVDTCRASRLGKTQASVNYNFDHSRAQCVDFVLTNLRGVALPPLRAREVSWHPSENGASYAECRAEVDAILSSTVGQPTAADMQAFSASEACCYLWPEDTDEHKALRAAYIKGAASVSTAGQEWRDRIGEALLPFGLLARRYDHHKAPDDEIVRSHGTLGKPGDRGYTHITVSDLRRAAALLDELAAAGPIVAEERQNG